MQGIKIATTALATAIPLGQWQDSFPLSTSWTSHWPCFPACDIHRSARDRPTSRRLGWLKDILHARTFYAWRPPCQAVCEPRNTFLCPQGNQTEGSSCIRCARRSVVTVNGTQSTITGLVDIRVRSGYLVLHIHHTRLLVSVAEAPFSTDRVEDGYRVTAVVFASTGMCIDSLIYMFMIPSMPNSVRDIPRHTTLRRVTWETWRLPCHQLGGQRSGHRPWCRGNWRPVWRSSTRRSRTSWNWWTCEPSLPCKLK